MSNKHVIEWRLGQKAVLRQKNKYGDRLRECDPDYWGHRRWFITNRRAVHFDELDTTYARHMGGWWLPEPGDEV